MGTLVISFGVFRLPAHSVDGDASYQFWCFQTTSTPCRWGR